jgi:autotransporter-associated beta strand protein
LPTRQNVSINGKGTLQLGAGGIDMSAGNHALTVNAPINLTGPQTWIIGQNALVMTLAGPVSGKEKLTKSGLGTLVLESTNVFNVPLDVEAGTVSLGQLTKAMAFPALTLSSNSTLSVKIDGTAHACDELKVAGPIVFRGNLMVWNLSGELKEGASFRLFEAASFAGAFDHITLPTLPANLTWNTNALTKGSLSVISSKSQP